MRFIAAVMIVVSLAHGSASADEQPWAVGVSDAAKADAQARLQEGNKLFLAKEYRAALDKYVAAIASWDHPAIQFNIVRCLMLLERPVEAAEHLDRALAYGAAPLEAGVYAEAQAVREQLARQLARLTVTCKLSDIVITLDGKPLPDCMGQLKRRVAAGPHQIVARKDGYVTFTKDFAASPDGDAVVDIRLVTVDEGSVYRRRWATWQPWSVVIAGGVIAVAGIGLELAARSNMDKFRDGVAMCGQAGCLADDPVNDFESRALLQDRIAISMWAVGGAVVATGLVMVYMNRERRVIAAPSIGAGVAGLTLRGSW